MPSDTACDPLGGYWTSTFSTSQRCVGCVCVYFEYQLPVELTTLEAIAGDRQVTLNWTTATEQDNDYFSILRNDVEMCRYAFHHGLLDDSSAGMGEDRRQLPS